MHASHLGITTIVGTDIAIVADKGHGRLASQFGVAGFYTIAVVSVVASEGLARDTANCRLTGFGAVADIVIVAHECDATDALPGLARIVGGANIAVATRNVVVGHDTAKLRVTRVVRARVIIRAIERSTRGAFSLGTHITDRAGIPIIAGKSLVVGNYRTLA